MAPDARDLSDPGDSLELVSEIPVLQRAELSQVMSTTPVDESVFVDPADTSSVGAEGGCDTRRQTARYEVQRFEHAAACPIEVCSKVIKIFDFYCTSPHLFVTWH